MNFKYITTMRETLMTTTDKNNFKIKMERVRDRNIFHSNKAQDLFTYGVNRPKITSIPDSDKKKIEERMWKYFSQPTIHTDIHSLLDYYKRTEQNYIATMAMEVELLTYPDYGDPANVLSYPAYSEAIRNIADENIARYTDAQKSLAHELMEEGKHASPDVQYSIFAAYQISSAILLSAIVNVTQFLASLIMNIGLWVEDLFSNIEDYFGIINRNISEGFVWALER